MENAACYAPQILVSTEDLPREQWLEYRRKGIGGSDAAAVLGISPFRTGRDLYYDKLNIVTADDAENWVQLEVGTLLEPLVAKIFAHKTGYKIYRRPFMFQHPLYPWMLADLDYMVELPDGTTAILEIKTTNYNAKDNWWYSGEEIIPIYYESQGRHYHIFAFINNSPVFWGEKSFLSVLVPAQKMYSMSVEINIDDSISEIQIDKNQMFFIAVPIHDANQQKGTMVLKTKTTSIIMK